MTHGSKNTQLVGIPRQSGMTAIELLIVVAAVGLLLLVTVPGSSMLVERYRLNAACNNLARGLSLARTEAVRRGSTVRMCPSVDGRSCLAGGDWSHGWLVYSDGNADGVVQEIELIEAFDEPAEDIRIAGTGTVQNGASFDLAGLVSDPESRRQSDGAQFRVCYAGSRLSDRSVVIDNEGWVNIIPRESSGCGPAAG